MNTDTITFQVAPHNQTNISDIGRARPAVKKILASQRRKKFKADLSFPWYRRLVDRLKNDSQFFRTTVQLAFALLCVWIGIEFYFFMQWGMTVGTEPYTQRPPGVEGFLPISALMGLMHWIYSGTLNTIHPAGSVILIGFIASSVIMKKSFCSWMCPIGTLSESLWMLGQKLFKRNINIWRWLDYPLRSLKYLLLFFFVYAIAAMSVNDLEIFINSPYNKVADIKMYLFFAEITPFALWAIIALMLFSIVIKNFWCRYLCPYGALLGLAGMLSPFRITRIKESCIDCELCTKACPSNITVHTVKQVWSDECTSCLRCVEECPVKETLVLRTKQKSATIAPWVFGTLVVGIFIAITGLGMLTGRWVNSVSKNEYLHRFQKLDSPIYNHAQGSVPEYGPND
ncbi:MAG: 4Fe-4S binding protein [Bacteriovoracaceae bacterium]|nr:4Fe-4S binding protein [Bacteroidota bacterium]